MNSPQGLQSSEIQERLAKYGYNELPQGSLRSHWTVLWEILKEPTLLLLIFAASIYLTLGDFSDGVFLFASVLAMLSISFYQENKAEKTLKSLRELSSPRAFVIREGREIRIPSRELVPDDLIVLHEGDRIPADAILLESKFLKTDESTLTGESLPVTKSPSSDGNLFLGSLVVGGHGTARVTQTGPATQLGKIGMSLKEISDERTPLQKKILGIVRKLAILAGVFCLLIAIVYGINFHDWIQGALSGVAAAISLLPEEFPLVLAIFLSMGAWRISQKQVLVRRLPALEALGSITRLCVDKTGTITQNQMTIQSLEAEGESFDLRANKTLPEKFHSLVEYAALASHVDPFDPMDKAIWNTLRALREPEHIHQDWTLVREYPLSDQLRAMSCVWKAPLADSYIVAAKGAPESILDLCHLDNSQKELQLSKVHELAQKGYRILAVARANFMQTPLPPQQHDFAFSWLGLLAMEDPIRKEAQAAVHECYEAGIEISMITGDYPETARHIGEQIGLKFPQQVVTGSALAEMKIAENPNQIKETSIFARILPQQKLDIITAFQKLGHIVAMTGDGVNDAPALRKADIGVAMGARGTDVAREASDLVLLDDNLASIVNAIRSGRRIFENIKKAFLYLLCIHIPIAGLAIFPALVKMPLLLFPTHLVILELLIDPTCTLAFEAEKESQNLMKTAPRRPSEPLLSARELIGSFLLGVFGFLVTFSVYWFALESQFTVEKARTLAFTTLIFWNLGAILIHRALRVQWNSFFSTKNKILNTVLLATVTLQILIVNIPAAAQLFHFTSLTFAEWLICFVLAVATILASTVLVRNFHIPNQQHKRPMSPSYL